MIIENSTMVISMVESGVSNEHIVGMMKSNEELMKEHRKHKCVNCDGTPRIVIRGYSKDIEGIFLCKKCALNLARILIQDIYALDI